MVASPFEPDVLDQRIAKLAEANREVLEEVPVDRNGPDGEEVDEGRVLLEDQALHFLVGRDPLLRIDRTCGLVERRVDFGVGKARVVLVIPGDATRVVPAKGNVR